LMLVPVEDTTLHVELKQHQDEIMTKLNEFGCVAVKSKSVPGVPSSLNLNVESFKATVEWQAPFDGGDPITSYELEMSQSNGEFKKIYTGTGLKHSVTLLDVGSYRFRVRSCNGVGSSQWSGVVEGKFLVREFKHVSPGDQNGLLYWLGTQRGTTAYGNPAKQGLVVVTRSSDGDGETSTAAGREPNLLCYTKNVEGSWYQFDLLKIQIRPISYSLRHDGVNNAHFLRKWVLEGSNDAIEWIPLRTHDNDTSINSANQWASWSVDNVGSAFRYFRIRLTGQNSSNHFHLVCNGFEMYGLISPLFQKK